MFFFLQQNQTEGQEGQHVIKSFIELLWQRFIKMTQFTVTKCDFVKVLKTDSEVR